MSEVTYRSERALAAPLAGWSARLELATRLDLTSHRLASENYQLMNYGLGGYIELHLDSNLAGGEVEYGEPRQWVVGGERLMTVMIILNRMLERTIILFR